MEKIILDSLFFLFGIPAAYLAVAVIVLINRKAREDMDKQR